MAEGASHIVQSIIAVDGGHYRNMQRHPQQCPHHVGPGAVAVDDLIAFLTDQVDQLAACSIDAAAHNVGGNTQCAGFVSKGAVPETDHAGSDGFVEILQQAQNMGFCAAGVAAADEVDHFHGWFLSSI